MNELPPTNHQAAESVDASSAASSSQTSGSPRPVSPPMPSLRDELHGARRSQAWIALVLAVLAVLLIGLWWNTQQELRGLREELAQRLRSGESSSAETKLMVRSLQDSTKEMQAKLTVLENKQIEAQSQQVALEQLYQELSRSRDEWALAEIEQVLSTASQQLQLAGNVQGALIALQNADNRLARSDKPQFILIRRAIARDMEQLRALPAVDVAGIALRLDTVISQIDRMPLLSNEKPAVPATPPKPSRAAADQTAQARNDWLATLENKWNSLSNELWSEISQLIRVRQVETPEALLLSPEQAYFVRENLKLRLLSARLALMARNEPAFRSDLVAVQDAIGKYFDTRARQTQTTIELLRHVQASNLAIEMPTLADSLGAVRNYKAE